MNTIALDNRMGIHFESSGGYNTCEALPIHQSTLTLEEMAGIDGLWDWNKFNSAIYNGMAVGTGLAVLGLGIAALSGPPGWVAAGAALGSGFVLGGAGGGLTYAVNELSKKETPETKTSNACKCSCACCR